MSIELRQGEKISAEELRFINKGEPLQKVRLNLSWEFKPDFPTDWDGSVVLLGNDGMMLADDPLIFYNKSITNDGAIKHTGDNHDGLMVCTDEDGDEIISIDLSSVSIKTHTILAVLTLFYCHPDEVYDTFKERYIESFQIATVKLYSEVPSGSHLLYRYDLSEVDAVCTALEMASFTRDGEGWSFQAIGQGVGEGFKQNGLEEVLK